MERAVMQEILPKDILRRISGETGAWDWMP